MTLNRHANWATARKTLDDPRFSEDQCDARFAAMLINDEIDLDAAPPDAIHLDYNPEQFTQCYRICRQLWKDRAVRETLREFVNHQIGFIRLNLAREKVTAKEFHEMRKIIGRQVVLTGSYREPQ